jgi:hypothetical protein
MAQELTYHYIIKNKDISGLYFTDSNNKSIEIQGLFISGGTFEEVKNNEDLNSPFLYYLDKNNNYGLAASGHIFQGLIDFYKLPFNDDSYYDNGHFISGTIFNSLEEYQKNLNNVIKYRKLDYYIGQINIYDDIPKVDEPFKLLENGYYYLTLSGPGYLNVDNHTKYEADWEKLSIKDNLKIEPNFTWSRVKEIDLGFKLHWYGIYSYTNDLIIFSLSRSGYQIGDSNPPVIVDNYVKYFGLMLGPIENNHVLKDARTGFISGVISGEVSGLIAGPASGLTSTAASGLGSVNIEGLGFGTVSNVVTRDVSMSVAKDIIGTVSGEVEIEVTEMGYATVPSAEISGKLVGNLWSLLNQTSITLPGEGTLGFEVRAASTPKWYSLSGIGQGTVENVVYTGTYSNIIDNVLISGLGIATFNNTLFTASASGIAKNVPVRGLIKGAINNVELSGIIKGTLNNTELSGLVSGLTQAMVSGNATGIVPEAVIADSISGIIYGVQISGIINGPTNNVSISGPVSGTHTIDISGLIYGSVYSSVIGDLENVAVYGTITLDPKSLLQTSAIPQALLAAAVPLFRTAIYNYINNIIVTNTNVRNEAINFFGATAVNILSLFKTAVDTIIDLNALYSLISPIFNSYSTRLSLTNDILSYMIFNMGQMVRENVGFYAYISGIARYTVSAPVPGTTYISLYNGNDGAIGDFYINGSFNLRSELLSQFRDAIIASYSSAMQTILSSININQVVSQTVLNTTVSGEITGPVSNLITGTVTNRVYKSCTGTASGVASARISGQLASSVERMITGTVSGIATGMISGIGYGTAYLSATVLAEGFASYNNQIILNSFMDDVFSDQTNFYMISGSLAVVGNFEKDIINPGGRGQLLNSIFINNNITEAEYDVGSFIDNSSTTFEMNDNQVKAVPGNVTEFPVYNNYYGGKGGNIALNSFDFYENHDDVENGFVRLIYVGPSELNLRQLEITSDEYISILPDVTSIIINNATINHILVENEAEVYCRMLKRELEIDLEKSTLNGIALNKFNIKYSEPIKLESGMSYNDREQIIINKYSNNEFYIIHLDNHRRKLLFKTPFKSIGDIPTRINLNLVTTDRKFYFAIARDNNIDTVRVNGILFDPEEQDSDLVYRKYRVRDEDDNIILDKEGNPIWNEYEFIAGERYELIVTFTNENSSLLKELIVNYLKDCSVNFIKSNNSTQVISFIMPKRDVLLFLKTEDCYTLTIYKHETEVEDSEGYIISIQHETDFLYHEDRIDKTIIVRHYKDDEILIEIIFANPYYEIDREFIASQLTDVATILYNDKERTRDPNGGPYKDIPQTFKFLMPARNVVLYIKRKDYRVPLKLLREKNSTHFTTVDIHSGTIENKTSEYRGRFVHIQTDNYFENEELFDAASYLYYPNNNIYIIVWFIADSNGCYFFHIDETFMTNQKNDITFEPRNLKNPEESGYNKRDQYMNFKMPVSELKLIIKEEDIRSNIIIRYNERQFLVNKGIKNNINSFYYKNKKHAISSNITRDLLIEEVIGTVIDVYVKFDNIYQQLDKPNIYSQFPSIDIEEPGDFKKYDSEQQQTLPNDIKFSHIYGRHNNISEIIDYINDVNTSANRQVNDWTLGNDHEFYQHFRFYMPQEKGKIIDLKWIDRRYGVTLNYKQEFVEAVQITDSNLLSNIKAYSEFKMELNNANFPHSTYHVIQNKSAGIYNQRIYVNVIQFLIKLKPYFELCYSEQDTIKDNNNNIQLEGSNFIIINENGDNKKEYFSSSYISPKKIITINNTYNYYNKLNPAIELKVPKKEVYINLTIQMKSFISIEKKDYMSDTLTLDAGTYRIILRGANGGNGGYVTSPFEYPGDQGYKGAEVSLGIRFKKSFSFIYMLGQQGFTAGGNTGKKGSGGGGGGGGGTSLMYWDCPGAFLEIYNLQINGYDTFTASKLQGIFCCGGNGGTGGNRTTYDTGGGSGGSGGITYRPNGRPGYTSGWRYRTGYRSDNYIGFPGTGGSGGMGWSISNMTDFFGSARYKVAYQDYIIHYQSGQNIDNGYLSIMGYRTLDPNIRI